MAPLNITYCTNNADKWGSGVGRRLHASEADENFYELEAAIQELTDNPPEAVSIDYFEVIGAGLFIHLTDNTIKGPYKLPIAQWTWKYLWQPNTNYYAYDLFTKNGATYLVLVNHVSASTFSAGANDGNGHNYYALILGAPDGILPTGGTTGQVLVKNSPADYDVSWVTISTTSGGDGGSGGNPLPGEDGEDGMDLYIPGPPGPQGPQGPAGENAIASADIVFFYPGSPTASQILFYMESVRSFHLPASLTGSRFRALVAPTSSVTLTLKKNGTSIGTLTWAAGQNVPTVTFASQVTFSVGDTFTVEAPSAEDTTFSQISVNLYGSR